MRRLPFFALAFALSPLASAQTAAYTALPMLEVPAVSEMGGATVARSSEDPLAMLQNPAQLGLAARAIGQSVSGAPSTTWFGESSYGAGAAAFGTSVGSLDLGVGIAAGSMNGEGRTLRDGTFYKPTDRYRALGVGVSTRGAVRAALGTTARLVTTTDAPVWAEGAFEVGSLYGVSFDLGALVSADVVALAGGPTIGALRPALAVTAGYAQTNLSGSIRYSGNSRQALPRMGALGWSATTGLDLPVGATSLRIVEAEAAFQAERSLVRDSDGLVSYAALSNGLAALDALAGSGNTSTTGRRGLRISLAETVEVSTGRFDGWGYDDVQTRSVAISTAGASKLISARLAPGPLATALARTDLKVGRTTVFAGTPDSASRTTLTLVIRR